MPSRQSVKWFLLINGIILPCATAQHYVPVLFLLKNLALLHLVKHFTEGKPFLQDGPRATESPVYLIQSTVIDAVMYTGIKHWLTIPTTSISSELAWFIPISFVFELLFDFFHYWTHRACHTSKWLYRNVHAVHHSTQNLHAAAAFKHHSLDLVLTNVVPLIATAWILPVPAYTFTVILWYKNLQEIGGHSGKAVKGSSFTQCKWLPELFGIALHSRNHNEHHRNPAVNFSKRFSLWDRMFGTFCG